LTVTDPRYPPQLADIHDPPPLLYVRGEVQLLSEPQIAIVGSRNPTPGGAEITQEFARHLTGYGLIVTSGLAQGIDGAAHLGALENGRTIAVFGTGLDRVYPAAHRTLARQIAENGALVSEFPPGCEPLAQNFPRRNRLISGLSLGVLVTEAALKSGSLITARTALEQGREVFAVPGSIRNPLARGCHALLRDGAKLVESAADILAELAPLLRVALTATATAVAPLDLALDGVTGLDSDSRAVLKAMGYEP
jgi:DNA processing protein